MNAWDDAYTRMQGGQGRGPGYNLTPEYQQARAARRAQKQALGIKADGSGGGRAALAAAGQPVSPFTGQRHINAPSVPTATQPSMGLGMVGSGNKSMLQTQPIDRGDRTFTQPLASPTLTTADQYRAARTPANSFPGSLNAPGTGGAGQTLGGMAMGGARPGSTYTPSGFTGTRSHTQPAPTTITNGAPSGLYAPGGQSASPDPYTSGPANIPSLPTGGAAGVGSGTPSSPVGYGFDVNEYLDPSMAFQMSEGMRALENSAAGRGSLQSGDTLRDIVRYSQGVASTDWNNAFNRASGVRDFTYGVDRDDRNFDYGVSRDDRNFDYNRLRDLANMGLSGTGTVSSGENMLAGILASLLGNRGQIEGSGAIGQGNAVNGSISQIINYLMNQQMTNALGSR